MTKLSLCHRLDVKYPCILVVANKRESEITCIPQAEQFACSLLQFPRTPHSQWSSRAQQCWWPAVVSRSKSWRSNQPSWRCQPVPAERWPSLRRNTRLPWTGGGPSSRKLCWDCRRPRSKMRWCPPRSGPADDGSSRWLAWSFPWRIIDFVVTFDFIL